MQPLRWRQRCVLRGLLRCGLALPLQKAPCIHAPPPCRRMLPDQSPSEFMLSVLSDPAAVEQAADQWAAAHPAAGAGSQGQNGAAAGAPAGQLKDVEGGAAGGAAGGGAPAGTAAHPLPAKGKSWMLRRAALQDNSVSVVQLAAFEHRGDSKLARLAMQVRRRGPASGEHPDSLCTRWHGSPSRRLTPLTCSPSQVRHLTARNFRWQRRQLATTLTIYATSVIAGGMLGGCMGLPAERGGRQAQGGA